MPRTKPATLVHAVNTSKATDRYNAKNTQTVTGQESAPMSARSPFEQALVQLKPAARRQFDVLKAEQGPRSGPKLIAEALNLLFEKYGKPTIP